jgi:hypothetical protein
LILDLPNRVTAPNTFGFVGAPAGGAVHPWRLSRSVPIRRVRQKVLI